MQHKILKWVLILLTIGLSACSEQKGPYSHGVYMLIDTSGTYTKELVQAQRIINFTLSKLNPGDTFAVARVDTGSFSEKTLSSNKRLMNAPAWRISKRKFRDQIDKFVKEAKPSAYTDITGGALQAIEYLNEANTGKKTIMIFSDLKEELRKGYVRDIPLQLNGVKVIALNVTKLRSDNIDPREYLDRLESWRGKVESGGGEWRVINDLERLDPLFD